MNKKILFALMRTFEVCRDIIKNDGVCKLEHCNFCPSHHCDEIICSAGTVSIDVKMTNC